MRVAFTEIVLSSSRNMDKIWAMAMNFSSTKPVKWLKSSSGVSKKCAYGEGWSVGGVLSTNLGARPLTQEGFYGILMDKGTLKRKKKGQNGS